MIIISDLFIGENYTQPQLAKMWGYKSYDALRKGVFTPRDQKIIVLFVTKNKVKDATQYHDDFDQNILYMMGQKKHGTDQRIYRNLNNRTDRIILFYREIHHTPFTYFGECYLIDAKINKEIPSEFTFSLTENINQNDESKAKNTMIEDQLEIFLEGNQSIKNHKIYERNPQNRAKAIQIHGLTCKICGFNFNEYYGDEISKNYIEIHHIKPLSDGVQIVNPIKDLIPVCSNCHSMLHRNIFDNISIEELTIQIKNKK